MTGTKRKTKATNSALATRDIRPRWLRGPLRPSRRGLSLGDPAVAKAGIIVDQIEFGIDVAEFLADTLDEGADIGAIAFGAVAGDEILAVHEVVDVAIGDILAGARYQQHQDVELGQREFQLLAAPVGSAGVGAQGEASVLDGLPRFRRRLGPRPPVLEDEVQPLEQDRQAPRLVDEIDRPA